MVVRLKNLETRIKSLPNKNNSICILDYYNYLKDRGVALNTQSANLQVILYYAEYLKDVNLRDVKDRQQVTSYLNTLVNHDDPDKRYVSTYNVYLLRLIGFYRWLYNYEQDGKQESFWTTPEFIKIRKKQTKRLSPYNSTEIWEKEELQSLLKYEPSIRNKAIITLLWDLDARPHEITLLRIKNIRLREKYGEGEIPFSAKTGSGPILLTFSFPYVRDWLNIHPDKNNSDAYLIYTRVGTGIIPMYINQVMRRLKARIKKLVIKGAISDQREKERLEYFLNTKKWNPYCIRHSAITADSDYLPEYALKKKVRWSMNSNQGTRYIKRRMGNELKNKILEYNGIITEETQKMKPMQSICPRCDLSNVLENKYCSKCSYPLKPEAFDEIKEEENKKIMELETRYKEMDTVLQNLVKAFSSVDEQGKQIIARQLIQSGNFD